MQDTKMQFWLKGVRFAGTEFNEPYQQDSKQQAIKLLFAKWWGWLKIKFGALLNGLNCYFYHYVI